MTLDQYRLALGVLTALAFALLLSMAARADELTSYMASYVCADGSVPSFNADPAGHTVLSYEAPQLNGVGTCHDGTLPAPARPDTPLLWRKYGLLSHSGDPNLYHEATNGIAGDDYFFDVTSTYDICQPAHWSPVADPACYDGVMNVVVPSGYAWSTWWGQPVQYFNGLPCPGRPLGDGVRYPVWTKRVGRWQPVDMWWPNQVTDKVTCKPDGLGRVAPGRVWRGRAWRDMLSEGRAMRVLAQVLFSETYWFPLPTSYAVERLEFDRFTGFGIYELFCDSSLPNCAAAAVPPPTITSIAGEDLSGPSIPTGTAGHWVPQIVVDFNDIEPAPQFTARQFVSTLPGFPGDLP